MKQRFCNFANIFDDICVSLIYKKRSLQNIVWINHPPLPDKRILFRATAILLSIYHYWPLKTHISKHITSSDQASFIFKSVCGTASSLKCPLYSVHLNSVTSGVILLWKSLTRSDAWFSVDSLKSKWTSCENMQHLKRAFLFEARSVWAPQSHWLVILLYSHTHTHSRWNLPPFHSTSSSPVSSGWGHNPSLGMLWFLAGLLLN